MRVLLLLAACLLSLPAAAGLLLAPVSPACISSPFGPRRLVGPHAATFHTGIDLPAPAGAWVVAAADGRVRQIRHLGPDGLEIDLDHGAFVTRYAHLGSVAPRLAEGAATVHAGERIGRIGRSGITYGTHLHFEVRLAGKPVDPELFLPLPRCT